MAVTTKAGDYLDPFAVVMSKARTASAQWYPRINFFNQNG